jgi:hypothetical protein
MEFYFDLVLYNFAYFCSPNVARLLSTPSIKYEETVYPGCCLAKNIIIFLSFLIYPLFFCGEIDFLFLLNTLGISLI